MGLEIHKELGNEIGVDNKKELFTKRYVAHAWLDMMTGKIIQVIIAHDPIPS